MCGFVFFFFAPLVALRGVTLRSEPLVYVGGRSRSGWGRLLPAQSASLWKQDYQRVPLQSRYSPQPPLPTPPKVYLGFPEGASLLLQLQCYLAPSGVEGNVFLTSTDIAFLPTNMAPKSGRKLKLKHLKALSKNRLKFRLASLTNMEALFYKRYCSACYLVALVSSPL